MNTDRRCSAGASTVIALLNPPRYSSMTFNSCSKLPAKCAASVVSPLSARIASFSQHVRHDMLHLFSVLQIVNAHVPVLCITNEWRLQSQDTVRTPYSCLNTQHNYPTAISCCMLYKNTFSLFVLPPCFSYHVYCSSILLACILSCLIKEY